MPPPGGPGLFEGTVEAFYAVPDPLPAGEPGTLLRYQPLGTVVPVEPDATLFILDMNDIGLWMFSDPVALLASPPGDGLVPDPLVEGSVDELVAWLVGHPEVDSSEPQPVSIGGLDGSRSTLRSLGPTSRSPTCPPAEVCVDVSLLASSDLNWLWGPAPWVRLSA